MKKYSKFIIGILLFAILFVGCTKNDNNLLNNNVYLKNTATIKIYEATNEAEQSLNTFLNESDYVLQRYKYITFNANKKWTYGLTLHAISFEILSNETATLDFTLTISHLKNAENYNSTYDFYYFQKQFYSECTANKPQKIYITVEDEFINKDAQISVLLDSSSFVKSRTIKYSIINLQMFGEHLRENY